MLTPNDKHWHANYEALPADLRDAVDHAYNEATRQLKVFGVAIANDDRAEALVAAITRYVVESDNVPKLTLAVVDRLGTYTKDTFQLERMMGPGNAMIMRRDIMETLTGGHVPLSACGINAVREALYAAAGVTTDEAFIAKCHEVAK